MTHLLRSLLILLLGSTATMAASSFPPPAEDPACRPATAVRVPFTPRPRGELLEQILNSDEPTMRMRGKLIIHALAPMQVELLLDSFQGDPQRIAALLALWTRQPVMKGISLPIHDLRLEGVVARLAGKGFDVQIDRAALPEGSVEKIHLLRDEKGRWELTVAAGNLPRLPAGIPGLPPLRDLSFSSLQATGNPACPGRIGVPDLAIEGIRATALLLELLDITPGYEMWQLWATRVVVPAALGDAPPPAPDSLPFLLQEARDVLQQLAQFAGLSSPSPEEPLVVE
ncbi:MAG: hypothetical protein HQL66_15730, partial [Magnetococcales bacterium]|nr:hypothetical protein [Magnetococcales bacterium]